MPVNLKLQEIQLNIEEIIFMKSQRITALSWLLYVASYLLTITTIFAWHLFQALQVFTYVCITTAYHYTTV